MSATCGLLKPEEGRWGPCGSRTSAEAKAAVDVRGRGCAALTDAHGLGGLLQSHQQGVPELAHELQVVLHGVAQVHKVVQVHRVTLGTEEADLQLLGLPWGQGSGGQRGTFRSTPRLRPRPRPRSLTGTQRDPHPLRCQLRGPLATATPGALAERLVLQHLLLAAGLFQLPWGATPSQQLLPRGAAPLFRLP